MKDLFLIVMFVSIGIAIGVGTMVYLTDNQECQNVKIAIPQIEKCEKCVKCVDWPGCPEQDDYPVLYNNDCPKQKECIDNCTECIDPLSDLTRNDLYDICMKTNLLCDYL